MPASANATTSQIMSVGDHDLTHRADGSPRRVLYAEDQISSRIVTKAMLERMGFIVDAVDDGELAVEKARCGDYDVVLLDIEMPVMDGVTAARVIRSENGNYKNTPILALSAFLADSTENCIWRDAFDTAVPKPANRKDLRLGLLRAMSKHNPMAAADSGSTDADSLPAWNAMRKTLPKGTRVLLVSTAAGEMEHIALALAAALEAGETEQLRAYRHSLRGLALNFGLPDVTKVIADTKKTPGDMDVSALLAMIRTWRDSSVETF